MVGKYAVRIAALSSVLVCGILKAQTEIPPNVYGIYAGANWNFHSADFRALPGVPNCCPRFGDDNGWSFGFGILYEYPFTQAMSIGARLGYSRLDATLRTIEGTTVIVGNETVRGEFEHSMTASIATLGLEPLLVFRHLDPLMVYIGGRASVVPLRSYEQSETLIKPEDYGVFKETGRRKRNESSGTIPRAQSGHLALTGGMHVRLPMNRNGTLFLAPEVFFTYTLSPIVADLDWSAHTIRIGAALLYTPQKTSDALPEVPRPVEPPREIAPALSATIDAIGLDENGNEVENPVYRMEEFVGVRMRPLLPYVFFSENSSDIPMRYHRLTEGETKSFSEDALHNLETLTIYYHVLNIIGKRMRSMPQAQITITGCNADDGSEKGNLALSLDRAHAVRDYLRDVWKIDESRMTVQKRNLPVLYSTMTERDGIEENRRVEISSSEWEILKPVITNDTIRVEVYPKVVFRPRVQSERGVESWKISVSNDGAEFTAFYGADEPPVHIPLAIEEKLDMLPEGVNTLTYVLTAKDSRGLQARTAPADIPVERLTVHHKRRERIADKYIDRYALILFDFDRADVVGMNSRIAEMIRDRLQKGAAVTIEGFTDRIGESRHNSQLSYRRSVEVRSALGWPSAKVQGHGETETLFDNNLPEGRMYCRTVNITVETPVEYEKSDSNQ